MTNLVDDQKCLSYMSCQLRSLSTAGNTQREPPPSITISRLTGSGGRTVARHLAEYLQSHAPSDCPWTVFDRNLVDRVLEEHQLSNRLAEFMTETHRSLLSDTIEEIMGLHPSSWTLVQQTAETIFNLAQLGHAIIVGRAANIVTRKLNHVFHARLVGSLDLRVSRIQQLQQLDPRAAREFIRKEDLGRKRYLHDHYAQDIDDPTLYDLVINTDRISYEEAARLIADAVIHRYHLKHEAPLAAAV